MKKILLIFFIAFTMKAQVKSFEQKVDSILSLMTIDEKVGQLVQFTGGTDTGTKTPKPKKVMKI